MLYFVFSEQMGLPVPIPVYGLVLGAAAVTLLLVGRYGVMEQVTKVLAGILFLSTVGVYLVDPAPFGALAHYVQVEVPGGSWLIIAAFLGLLPTGIDVSLQASEWGKAKRVGMGLIRERLERMGLAPVFDPMRARSADLRVDTSALPEHAAGVLPALVPDRAARLRARPRGVVPSVAVVVLAAGRGVALSEPGRGQRRHGRDRPASSPRASGRP